MAEPLILKKVVYLVEATGRSARTLEELLRVMLIVPPSSVGYHMHREFLASPQVLPEYPNDFAMWAGKILGDTRLAERLANLRVFKHRSLETLQAEIGRLVAEEMVSFPEAQSLAVPTDRAFHFALARALVLDTNRSARDLAELRKAVSEIDASGLYYHLFQTRFRTVAGGNSDIAEWLHGIGEKDLADRVGALDPYMFSLEGVRRALLNLLPGSGHEAPAEVRR